MKLRHITAVLGGIFSVGTPAVAVAPEIQLAGRATIDIVGWVPVVCRASVDTTTIAPTAGTVQLGSLNEFCNNPNGYRVVADYSPALQGATLSVDGNAIQFESAGSTVVSSSNEPAITSHSLSLDVPEGVSDAAISFRIEPL